MQDEDNFRVVFGKSNLRKNDSGQLVSWNKPPDDWLKLNTDGSSIGNQGKAEAGCLHQISMGNGVGGLSCYVGYASRMLAELWAVHEGLRLARDMGAGRLLAKMDSKEALHLFTKQSDPCHPHFGLLQDTASFQERDWMCKFQYILREEMPVRTT